MSTEGSYFRKIAYDHDTIKEAMENLGGKN